jgi:2,3-bisphosphoglycerate-independent phosphoglycerate mutase
MKRPTVLIIMDGVGLEEEGEGNAVSLANTPNLDQLMKEYPTSALRASGEAVGLPKGQMGNSEVGHMNIGGGRVVYQSLTRIHKAVKDGSFQENEAYKDAMTHVKSQGSKLHIMGLLSDGGVHSHISHFKGMLDFAKSEGLEKVYVHAFLDGRDVPPESAITYIEELEAYMKEIGLGKIASVHGRYYAMDRDKRWERIKKAYDILTEAKGEQAKTAVEGIKSSYENSIQDEFVIPFSVDSEGTVEDGDSIVFMNFRPDRAIQISTALTNPSKTELEDTKEFKDLHFVQTMHYSDNVKGSVAFEPQKLEDMYGDIISREGLKQLRIAETEKYAHVTFFFDGGKDRKIEGSKRIMVPSPKVATYDMQPEMSAYEVTDKVLAELDKNELDTIILNFANCDMVGHTGDIQAAKKAVEVTDECTGKVVEKIVAMGGMALITADHGNAEKMIDDIGGVQTSHTTSLVPLIITDKTIEIRENGILGDLVPTMLEYLEIDQPKAMTGQSLIAKKK